MFIQTEATDDPNVIRFFPGVPVLEQGEMHFRTAEEAAGSPLADSLLAMNDVELVVLGVDSIAIGKLAEVEWHHLKPSVLGAIMEHFVAGRPVLRAPPAALESPVERDEDREIITQVKELIVTRISPALTDAGVVEYRGYSDGVVQLSLEGQAKSHTAAITNMFKHFIPEITAIRDVSMVGGEGRDGPQGQIIQKILDKDVNPAIASHGGYITLIDVKDNLAYVELGGGCQGCGMANVTLKQGVEVAIQEALPEITGVLDVTDHAGGDNPYYQPSKK